MKPFSTLVPLGLAAASLAPAQLMPIVGPRGVVNAFTQEPAPSSVAPGGLIWINGLNLGAAAETQVLVNGAPARVLSVAMSRIVAQMPADAAPGLAEVVVQRGAGRSRAARILIEAAVPAVRSAADTGFGEAFITMTGDAAVLTAGGFGPAAAPVTVHVGGLPSAAELAARDGRPGEFEVTVSLPAGRQAGEVVSLRAGVRTANRTTLEKSAGPEVSLLRLPAGAPELRSLTGSDLRPNYGIASAARDDQGCSPSYLIDASRKTVTSIEPCLVSGNQNDIAPAVFENEGAGLAALAGPAGVSSKVLLFHPERADPLIVQLPAAASSLNSLGTGGVTAVLAGEPARRVVIDTRTGEVREAAGSAAPGPGGFGLPLDLGDGLRQVLSAPVAGAGGVTGVVVGDHADRPTQMKFALVNAQGEVAAQSFPDGWLALFGAPAAAPAAPGGGQGQGGTPAGLRASVVYQPFSREFYVAARDASNTMHGLAAFPENGGARLVRFPGGWFAAACTTRIPLYSFQLSSSVAAPVLPVLETESRNPCLARGLVVAEPGAEQGSLISLTGQGAINVSGAAAGVMNDFIYGGNAATPDTLVVFDAATGAAAQLSLPAGVSSFSGVTQVPAMNALIATATNRAQGDAGFVVFDLEAGEARVLGPPDRFSSISLAGVFPVTRKLAAKGTRSDGTGSQFIVYDLVTGEPAVLANPEGVGWVGSLPQQTATGPGGGGGMPGLPGAALPGVGLGGGGLQQANPKANSITAVGFDAGRKQAGIVAVRIP